MIALGIASVQVLDNIGCRHGCTKRMDDGSLYNPARSSGWTNFLPSRTCRSIFHFILYKPQALYYWDVYECLLTWLPGLYFYSLSLSLLYNMITCWYVVVSIKDTCVPMKCMHSHVICGQAYLPWWPMMGACTQLYFSSEFSTRSNSIPVEHEMTWTWTWHTQHSSTWHAMKHHGVNHRHDGVARHDATRDDIA